MIKELITLYLKTLSKIFNPKEIEKVIDLEKKKKELIEKEYEEKIVKIKEST